MDYKFYQGLVERQANEGENPAAGFSKFLEELFSGREHTAKITLRLHGILFPGGGISEDGEHDLLGVLELINPEKMFPIFELMSLNQESEENGNKKAEKVFRKRLKRMGVPEERFAEVRKLIREMRQSAEEASQLEDKKTALLKKMYVEQAELYKKYIGLFEEAFNEKS